MHGFLYPYRIEHLQNRRLGCLAPRYRLVVGFKVQLVFALGPHVSLTHFRISSLEIVHDSIGQSSIFFFFFVFVFVFVFFFFVAIFAGVAIFAEVAIFAGVAVFVGVTVRFSLSSAIAFTLVAIVAPIGGGSATLVAHHFILV